MSGTADWSDTTNTLNITVKQLKHIHCVLLSNKLTKTKKKVVEITNFKTQFYNFRKIQFCNLGHIYKYALKLVHKQSIILKKKLIFSSCTRPNFTNFIKRY